MIATATPSLIATAEALFNAVAPKGLTSASHPFKVWSDQTQKHFLELARLYQ